MLFPSALMWLVFGALSAYFAKIRGKNPYLWFFLGMLFGIFGLLFLIFAPRGKTVSATRQGASGQRQSQEEAQTIDVTPPYDPKYNEKFWYYLDAQNNQFGPMSFDALYRLFKEGLVTKQTYVWNESFEEWQFLGNFLNS